MPDHAGRSLSGLFFHVSADSCSVTILSNQSSSELAGNPLLGKGFAQAVGEILVAGKYLNRLLLEQRQYRFILLRFR
jgi:hypothetical protein